MNYVQVMVIVMIARCVPEYRPNFLYGIIKWIFFPDGYF